MLDFISFRFTGIGNKSRSDSRLEPEKWAYRGPIHDLSATILASSKYIFTNKRRLQIYCYISKHIYSCDFYIHQLNVCNFFFLFSFVLMRMFAYKLWLFLTHRSAIKNMTIQTNFDKHSDILLDFMNHKIIIVCMSSKDIYISCSHANVLFFLYCFVVGSFF